MKTKPILIIAILVILAAAVYFFTKDSNPTLTEESATTMVTQLPEVKQLEESLSKTTGSKLVYEVVSDSKFYNVKVSTENNNVKTLFNVYFVDKMTGEVSTNVEGE